MLLFASLWFFFPLPIFDQSIFDTSHVPSSRNRSGHSVMSKPFLTSLAQSNSNPDLLSQNQSLIESNQTGGGLPTFQPESKLVPTLLPIPVTIRYHPHLDVWCNLFIRKVDNVYMSCSPTSYHTHICHTIVLTNIIVRCTTLARKTTSPKHVR